MKTSLILDVLEQVEGEFSTHGYSPLDMRQVRAAIKEVEEYETPESMVTEFHRKMGLPVAPEPTVGTPEQRCLRVRLMLEEVLEFAKAAGVRVQLSHGRPVIDGTTELNFTAWATPDITQMTHELADVQYVVSGTAVELGLPLREAVPLIHEANMRKEPGNKDAGGKIRKPEGWTPADVSGLLKASK